MAEALCGKDCAVCADREELSCPGCQNGPGRRFQNKCEVAVCCHEKGHVLCNSCSFFPSCGRLRDRDRMPRTFLRQRMEEQERKERLANNAAFNARWLMLLFFMVIPDVVVSILTAEVITNWIPGLFWPGECLRILCLAACCVILFKLSKNCEDYRRAGICILIGGGVGTVVTMLFGGSDLPGWSLLLTLPAMVIRLYGEYKEYQAHAYILKDADQEMAEKWEKLWKWYWISYAAMFGSIVVMLIMPVVGLLVMLAAVIGVLVVGIMKIVYLYRSAVIFKEHIPQVEAA